MRSSGLAAVAFRKREESASDSQKRPSVPGESLRSVVEDDETWCGEMPQASVMKPALVHVSLWHRWMIARRISEVRVGKL